MKKVMLLAAAALLAPTAAVATNGPRQGGENPAHMCRAMQAANPTLFHATWHTFGKCVSAHAHARGNHPHGTFTFTHLVLNSHGTVTDEGASNCQTASAGCTMTLSGTISGGFAGTYTSTYTILWTQSTSNGAGGLCAPATGKTTLTIPALGTLTKNEKGTVCEVGPSGPNVAHAMKDGTFTVSGGTGVFAGATGTGTTTFTQKPGPTSPHGGVEDDVEAFTTLTIKQ